MISTAQFSEDRKYRQALVRIWAPGATGRVLGCFIGKNPSDAAEETNDPTMIREIAFGQRWGWRGLLKENIWDYIATESKELCHVSDSLIVSPEGLIAKVIERIKAHGCSIVVCAWGTHTNRRLADRLRERGDHMRRALVAAGLAPHYLKLNQDKTPAHTLYLDPALKPIPWEPNS